MLKSTGNNQNKSYRSFLPTLNLFNFRNKNFSCADLIFLMFSYIKVSYQDFVSHFLLDCYYWSWVKGTVNIELCFNHAKTTPMVGNKQANTYSESVMRALEWTTQNQCYCYRFGYLMLTGHVNTCFW